MKRIIRKIFKFIYETKIFNWYLSSILIVLICSVAFIGTIIYIIFVFPVLFRPQFIVFVVWVQKKVWPFVKDNFVTEFVTILLIVPISGLIQRMCKKTSNKVKELIDIDEDIEMD